MNCTSYEDSDGESNGVPCGPVRRRTAGWYWLAGVLGILLIIFPSEYRPDFYYGSVQGSFVLSGPDRSYYTVEFESKSKPQWRWAKPDNFSYAVINLSVASLNNYAVSSHPPQATLSFPSSVLKYEEAVVPFSRESLIEFWNPAPSPQADAAFLEQVNTLYELLLSAGNGSLPKPRHHMYHYEHPFTGTLTHFGLSHAILPHIGILTMATALLLWFTGAVKADRRNLAKGLQTYHRITLITAAVVINYSAMLVGILLTAFGDFFSKLSGILIPATLIIGILLFPISIIYAAERWRATKQWDTLGVSLAVILSLVILFLSSFQY